MATGLTIRACQDDRVLFNTAAQWVTLLAEADAAGRQQDELTRPGVTPCWSSIYAEAATMPSRYAGIWRSQRVR